uniref:FK506-binding protein 59 n=1 Tax=Cacopsylla melanoneura TaxID=428564 RepID=A0A8D8VZB6_9HEMI
MVSLKTTVNKLSPTVNSVCKILISKLDMSPDNKDEFNSDYLVCEGEVNIDLEQVHFNTDIAFMKLLLTTKLGDSGTFRTTYLKIEFKLVDITRTASIYEISDEYKLVRAVQHKEKGSQLFKENKLEAAFHRFKTSLRYLIFLNDKTLLGADDVYTMVCNNMAMCQMKFNNHHYAIELCNKVSNIDKMNVKALYRRATCYVELKQYDKAYADLTLAQSKESNNPSVKKLMDIVKVQRKQQHEEYKSVVKKMFR